MRWRRSPPSAPAGASVPVAESVDELAARRTRFLTEYQDERYAQRYADAVARHARGGGARGAGPRRPDRSGGAQPLPPDGDQGRVRGGAALHRRLVRAPAGEQLRRLGQARLSPGAAALRQARQGNRPPPEDRPTGPASCACCGCLRAIGGLRGSWLDPFGHTAERRMERRLLADYEATLAHDPRDACRPRTITWPWRLPAIRRRFAASATSRPRRSSRALPEAAARREAFLAGGVQAEAAE